MNKEKEGKNAEISARITGIIEYLGETANGFAKKLGYERAQTVYDILNMKSAPSYDFFFRFSNTGYSAFIDLDWLLTGRGSMLRSGQEQPIPQPVIQSTPPGDDSFIYNMYKEEKEENKALIEDIGGLKERIRTLEERISTYQDKEPECPTAASLITEAFTSEPFGDSVKDSIHTRNPTTSSKKLLGVKT